MLPVQIVIKRTIGDDYPLEISIGRTLSAAQRSTLLTGAAVTLTVNGEPLVGTITSASAGLVQFTIPSTIYNLAAGSYTALLRLVDSGGFTRTLADGTWRQRAVGA